MSIQLFTPRLHLRQFQTADAPHLLELNSDPAVLRFVPDGPYDSEKTVRQWIETYDQYDRWGTGRLAVIRREDGAFLGWCGLKYLEETGEVDLGYRFMQRYWGRGYATEAALPCLDYAFNILGLAEVVGRAEAENTASIHILEKLGMTYWKKFDAHGRPGVYYRIQRP